MVAVHFYLFFFLFWDKIVGLVLKPKGNALIFIYGERVNILR